MSLTRKLLVAVAVLIAGMATPAAASAATTDVVFVFDTTGSMSSTLSDARSQAGEVMTELRGRLGGDVQFGVAEVKDYPDLYGSARDTPYRLVQGVTGDPARVQTALDGLEAEGGGDNAESYGRALREVERDPAVGWRTGARRLVVLIADNVPHDNDLNALLPAELHNGDVWNTGQDPGPDGVVGTADDLDWDTAVLPTLRTNGLRIAMVLVQSRNYLEHWRTWARITGGDAVDGTETDFSRSVIDIADAVSKLPDPPCPDGQARNPAGRCVPTTAVVFVSGLASTQRFADPASVSLCPDGGTWQRTAADAMTFPQMTGRFQMFLAPMDRGGAVTPDCPGVAATTAEAMHQDSALYSNHDTNGARLTTFLSFLASNYAIRDVYLVGHSYGGIWSRAALTQLTRASAPPVRIAGIVTVGTPHTGSWAADLNDRLRFTCLLEFGPVKPSCLAREAIKVAYGEAVRGLTADVMRSWNPSQNNQAPWGCVPVGTLAGDFFKVPPAGYGGAYYSPHDLVVGAASAHASGASIANVGRLGQHDTVHVPLTLPGYPNDRVMTTDGRVRDAIINFVTKPPLIGPNCNAPITFEHAGAGPAADPGVSVTHAAASKKRPRVQRVPFVERPVTRGRAGRIPAPKAGQTLVLVNGASAFCGSRRIDTLPLFGLPEVQVAAGTHCRRSTVRIAAGKGRSGATVVVRSKAGLAIRTPRAERLNLALYGVPARSRARVRLSTSTGRVVARFTLRGRKALTRELSPGVYTISVDQKAPRRTVTTQVRV